MLLSDSQAAFVEKKTDRLSSEELVAHLNGLEERPWSEFSRGKPLSKTQLARMLGRFNINSGTIRLSDTRTAKGYYKTAFEEAFACYLPPENVTTSQANNDGHCDAFQNVTTDQLVTFLKSQKPLQRSDCDVVTFSPP